MGYNPNPANKSWNDSMDSIRVTLNKWGASGGTWKCEMSNVATGVGKNHWAFSSWPVDKVGVELRFTPKDGHERVIFVDKFGTPHDNLWAIAIGIEQIRLNELRGLDEVFKQFYPALPAGEPERDPYEVLGVRADAQLATIEASYKALVKVYHEGGSAPDSRKWADVNAAWSKVKEERAS